MKDRENLEESRVHLRYDSADGADAGVSLTHRRKQHTQEPQASEPGFKGTGWRAPQRGNAHAAIMWREAELHQERNWRDLSFPLFFLSFLLLSSSSLLSYTMTNTGMQNSLETLPASE